MINMKDGTTLVGARDEYGYPVRVYDDNDGPLFICGDENGVSMIIRASSFESAHGIWMDESPTIDEADLPEAFGFYGDDAAEKFQAAALDTLDDDGNPELVEGYRYQDNCTGTGIVSTSDYEWMREVDREELERREIRLVIRHDDDADEAEHVKFVCESYAYTMTVRGKSKRFDSYSILSDVGKRLRRLERALGAVRAETTWAT